MPKIYDEFITFKVASFALHNQQAILVDCNGIQFIANVVFVVSRFSKLHAGFTILYSGILQAVPHVLFNPATP